MKNFLVPHSADARDLAQAFSWVCESYSDVAWKRTPPDAAQVRLTDTEVEDYVLVAESEDQYVLLEPGPLLDPKRCVVILPKTMVSLMPRQGSIDRSCQRKALFPTVMEYAGMMVLLLSIPGPEPNRSYTATEVPLPSAPASPASSPADDLEKQLQAARLKNAQDLVRVFEELNKAFPHPEALSDSREATLRSARFSLQNEDYEKAQELLRGLIDKSKKKN